MDADWPMALWYERTPRINVPSVTSVLFIFDTLRVNAEIFQ
jgi:hypothetical protein